MRIFIVEINGSTRNKIKGCKLYIKERWVT